MRVPYNWLKDYIDTNLEPQEIARLLTMAGHALDKPIYEQAGDTVMDLEDRGNRADAVGILGLARDLSALTHGKLKEPPVGKMPKVDNEIFAPKISVESNKVTRWVAVVFKNIKVEPSPNWLQKRLKAYGIDIINNIVDITNYVMIELGMPLHAFDLDKVGEVILRPAKKGEKLITFEGTTLELDGNDLVAADSQKPLTLTTAVGGRQSGISPSTKNILVEAGLYHQPTARQSAIKHNVRNETSNRLGKYLHPDFCPLAVERFIFLMKEILHVEPEAMSFDYYPQPYQPTVIELAQKRLNQIAGEDIDFGEATKILEKLGFIPKTGINPLKEVIAFEVPYFRADVNLEEDLVEDVLRIRGYDKIPTILPARPSPTPLHFPEMELENKIRDLAVSLGFNETIGNQIIDHSESKKAGLTGKDWEQKMIFLENSWNQELNLMRPEMISGQLNYLSSYQKQGIDDIRIFEIGKTYTKDPKKSGLGKYLETRKIVFTITGGFNELKSLIETFLEEIGLPGCEFEKIDFLFKRSRGASIVLNGEELGKMGEVKSSVLNSFGISGTVSHAVFYTSKFLGVLPEETLPKVLTKIENFISEDKTLVVDERQEVGRILKDLKTQKPNSTITFLGFYQDEKLKKQGKKSISFNTKTISPKDLVSKADLI